MNVTPNPKKHKRIVRGIVSLIIMLGLSGVIVLYGNQLFDFVAARTFTPSADVKTIHDTLSLTDQASDIFYASRPSVESSDQFNASCNTTERTTAILGCYYHRTIYIYNVTNSELAGAKDVSAAHEMLHAAYERLNFIDKAHVDKLIQDEYAKQKDNSDLQRLMAYYKQAEPDALINELHSLLGTTVASLSPELESYYSRYFHDRQKIVKINTQYNNVFVEIEAKANELTNTIDTMKTEIQASITAYTSEVTALNEAISLFNTRAQSGYYTSTTQFNKDKQALESRINNANAERSAINSKVTEYNSYVSDLNKLSVRAQQLNSSLNGITTPEVSL